MEPGEEARANLVFTNDCEPIGTSLEPFMAPKGPPGLHRLVYASTAVGVLPAHQLDRILLRARAFNPSAAITGLLVFHEGTFLQCVEGPEAGVLSLMERIRRDRRHGGITLLESGSCAARAFPDSSMGYVAPRNLTSGQRNGFVDVLAAVRDRAKLKLADHVWPFLSTFGDFAAA
jgi:Sensors of blue-light using FAD